MVSIVARNSFLIGEFAAPSLVLWNFQTLLIVLEGLWLQQLGSKRLFGLARSWPKWFDPLARPAELFWNGAPGPTDVSTEPWLVVVGFAGWF